MRFFVKHCAYRTPQIWFTTRKLAYTPVRWRLQIQSPKSKIQIQSCHHRYYLFLQSEGIKERWTAVYTTYAHLVGASFELAPPWRTFISHETKASQVKLYTRLSIGCFNRSRPPLLLRIQQWHSFKEQHSINSRVIANPRSRPNLGRFFRKIVRHSESEHVCVGHKPETESPTLVSS